MSKHSAASRAALKTDQSDLAVDLRSVPRLSRIDNDRVFELAKAAVPYDYVSVSGIDLENYRVGSFRIAATTFPPAFVEAYTEERLFENDPLVLAHRRSGATLVTDEQAGLANETAPRLQYLLDSFRISNRIAVFVGRAETAYGAVVLSRESGAFTPDEAEFLATIAPSLHERVLGSVRRRFLAQELGLTDGELECLRLIAKGYTSEEAASASRFSKDTVDTYLKAATRKLKASNRLHAIAEALRRKLID